jgi:hypothetical protein
MHSVVHDEDGSSPMPSSSSLMFVAANHRHGERPVAVAISTALQNRHAPSILRFPFSATQSPCPPLQMRSEGSDVPLTSAVAFVRINPAIQLSLHNSWRNVHNVCFVLGSIALPKTMPCFLRMRIFTTLCRLFMMIELPESLLESKLDACEFVFRLGKSNQILTGVGPTLTSCSRVTWKAAIFPFVRSAGN